MTTKRCITCFCEKSLDGFYRHPKMADGHLNKCIVCVKAYMSCEVCGRETVHAHHDDYSKPLQVRWLCIAHHAEHHRRAALIAHLSGVQKQQQAA